MSDNNNTVGVQQPLVADNSDGNEEERRLNRRRVLKAGTIAYANRQCTLECTVRDYAETGAKLKVLRSSDVPNTFDLNVELDGSWVECEVIWRKETEVGVNFTSPISYKKVTRQQVVASSDAGPKPSLRRKPIR